MDTCEEFLMGVARFSKQPLDGVWCNAHVQPLVDEHFRVFRDVALNDVEKMLETGFASLTIMQQKKTDGPIMLAPDALRLVKDWYNRIALDGSEVFQTNASRRRLARVQQSELLEAMELSHELNTHTHAQNM